MLLQNFRQFDIEIRIAFSSKHFLFDSSQKCTIFSLFNAQSLSIRQSPVHCTICRTTFGHRPFITYYSKSLRLWIIDMSTKDSEVALKKNLQVVMSHVMGRHICQKEVLKRQSCLSAYKFLTFANFTSFICKLGLINWVVKGSVGYILSKNILSFDGFFKPIHFFKIQIFKPFFNPFGEVLHLSFMRLPAGLQYLSINIVQKDVSIRSCQRFFFLAPSAPSMPFLCKRHDFYRGVWRSSYIVNHY